MPDKRISTLIQKRSIAYIIMVIILAVIFFPFPHISFAQSKDSITPQGNGPKIQSATLGIQGFYQSSNWVPVQVTMNNNGADFQGKLSIEVPSATSILTNNITDASYYQEQIDLPSVSNKQVTLTVPLNVNTQLNQFPVQVKLLDQNNNVVSATSLKIANQSTNSVAIGILSDQTNFGSLSTALQSVSKSIIVQTYPLTATTLPDQAEILGNFDAIILDNFSTASLSPQQIDALQSWVKQGGSLIITGGPEWQRTLTPLPADLLPVTLKGTDTVPAGTQLIPIDQSTGDDQGQKDTLTTPVTISKSQLKAGSTAMLTNGNMPLIAQATVGEGHVSYIAYDPSLDPFINWNNTGSLWNDLLTRNLGNELLSMNSGNNTQFAEKSTALDTAMDSLLGAFFPQFYPSLWLILGLLLSYVLILGPIRLAIIHHFHKPAWSWRIIIVTILSFTLVSYGLAAQEKGSSIVSSTVSLVQLEPSGNSESNEHETTYIGVFVPNQGNFQIQIPGTHLVRLSSTSNTNSLSGAGSIRPSTIETTPAGSTVNLEGVNLWTEHTIVAQQDDRVSGSISGNLQLQGQTVTGTISNTLPYDLLNASLLIGNDEVQIGDLLQHQTKPMTLRLINSLSTNINNGSTTSTIADQIAQQQGLNGQNFINGISQSLQNETERRIALLETLSSNNCTSANQPNICYQTMINTLGTFKHAIAFGSGESNNRDPLLLPGATATLIGWRKDPTDLGSNFTVNGDHPGNRQETLVQAPLSVSLSNNAQIPSSLVKSELIQIQQNQDANIQEPSPGIYTMTTGNITMEYFLPQTASAAKKSMTFFVNTGLNNYQVQTNNTFVDISHVQCYLYNWQTSHWDAFTFTPTQLSLSNAQPYINAQGRILLRLTNTDTSLGTIIFSKPNITVQTSI